MIKVGLTGGIGSGKSLISMVFNRLGVPIYDSDSATKLLYHSNLELKKELIKAFGKQTYDTNGMLNRSYLGKLVFNNKNNLQLINKIVHPKVKQDFKGWLVENCSAAYIIKEAAILIESKAYQQLDKIIVVSAPIDLRVARVVKRDNTTDKEVNKRIESQLSEEELLGYADFTIRNNEKEALLPQIINIHSELLKM